MLIIIMVMTVPFNHHIPKYHNIPGTQSTNSIEKIICRILYKAKFPLLDLLLSWPITANITNRTAFPVWKTNKKKRFELVSYGMGSNFWLTFYTQYKSPDWLIHTDWSIHTLGSSGWKREWACVRETRKGLLMRPFFLVPTTSKRLLCRLDPYMYIWILKESVEWIW